MARQPHLEKRLERVLARFEERRKTALDAEAQWEAAFFAGGAQDPRTLAATEKHRLDCRVAYNEMRRQFSFLRRGNNVPNIRWELRSPMESAADYARIILNQDELFAPPDTLPPVVASDSFVDTAGRHYWLRFPSPSKRMADDVVARVLEPDGIEDPPTLIFLHGICVEFDHWHGMIDDVAELSRQGVRTVRLEAPWHGRRVADGRYGGEKFIGTMPLGSLEYFSAMVREAAVLIDWCRHSTNGAVALGGSSLGAHVARLTATSALHWDAALQPDALLLITPCGKLEDAAINGAFADIWNTAENSMRSGWTTTLRNKYFDLLDPTDNPAVPAAKIVAVLGTHDRVTPYHSGRELIQRMGLPPENVFVRRQGHFSTPINLVRDKSPLQRFCQLLSETQQAR